jgi:methylated-DNA-[protein]-cysteine S-methyltransferase
VWERVQSIPRGQTRSYMDIARELRSGPRPVGMACGANRIPLVIPCHRVVASRGIGGFMHSRGGHAIEIKRWLLRHEGVKGLQ